MTKTGKIKILCIEDEIVIVDYISSLLDKNVYEFSSIVDGKDGLDYLLSATTPPDIVLLDYVLPSMNGIQILKELKAHKKNYAVIFLTADETLETAVAAMKDGALDYLTKSNNLKTEINIKIEKNYQVYKDRQKTEYFEEQLMLFEMAIEQSPNSVVITNKNGIIEFVNKQFITSTGYTFEEVKGKTPRILRTENYPPNFFKNLWDTISAGKTWKGEFVNKRKNGDLFYEKATITPILNKAGEIVSYLSIKEDITELKKSEQSLKESEARFRSIFEMANSGIFFSDDNGQIILVNQALQNMVEYSSKELYLMDFSQFTHLDDLSTENELLKKLIRKEINQYRIEKRYESKSGKIIWVDLAVAVIRSENGDPLYYVGVVNDISERKQYEQQLKNVNITKDKFFSIISHDLRNQFSGIQGLSEVLMASWDELTEENKSKYVSILHSGGKSALTLLENLIEWSRSQLDRLEVALKPHNLFDVAHNVIQSIENQATIKKIAIFNNVDKKQQVVADYNMLSTVLRNLLNNAVKFTASGGEVTLNARSDGSHSFISIKDTGIGMDKETLAKLFKIENTQSTFGTHQERGSGLGLILCREFILKHGGEIQVKSKVGVGSEFIISIPKRSLTKD